MNSLETGGSHNIQHKHIMIKAEVSNPKALDLRQLERWMRMTVEEQGMKIVVEPRMVMVEDEGNEGPTGSCNLSTSHMAIHIWDNTGIIQSDLYTCGCLDVKKFINAFDVFGIKQVEYMVLDRANGFQVIRAGKLSGSNHITRGV